MSSAIFPTTTKVTAEIILVGSALMVRLTAPNKPPQTLAPEGWLIDFFNLAEEFAEANDWLANEFLNLNENWMPSPLIKSRALDKLTSTLSLEDEFKLSKSGLKK